LLDSLANIANSYPENHLIEYIAVQLKECLISITSYNAKNAGQ